MRVREPHPPPVRPRGGGPLAALVAACLAARAAAAPHVALTPPTGTGRAGEVLTLAGTGFPPSATLSVTVGNVATAPETITTDPSGAIPPTLILLTRALPGGRHAVAVSGSPAVAFRNAFLVRPLVTLDPPIGDGRAGATWRTNKAIFAGGHSGMVFVLDGTGFPKEGFIPADSIRLGKTPTVHDPIRVGPDGSLPSTTIVVSAALQSGRYDLVMSPPGGAAVTFPSAYHVAPWAATDTIRQRAASRALDGARRELKDLLAVGGELLAPEDVNDVTGGLKGAEAELKTGNFENAEDLSRQVRDKLSALGRQVEEVRREKLRSLAEVVAAGFDTLQPPGAPAPRAGGATIEQGRRKLKDAEAAIGAGRFDQAKTLIKAANDALKKARAEAGVGGSEEPIRW